MPPKPFWSTSATRLCSFERLVKVMNRSCPLLMAWHTWSPRYKPKTWMWSFLPVSVFMSSCLRWSLWWCLRRDRRRKAGMARLSFCRSTCRSCQSWTVLSMYGPSFSRLAGRMEMKSTYCESVRSLWVTALWSTDSSTDTDRSRGWVSSSNAPFRLFRKFVNSSVLLLDSSEEGPSSQITSRPSKLLSFKYVNTVWTTVSTPASSADISSNLDDLTSKPSKIFKVGFLSFIFLRVTLSSSDKLWR